MDSLCNIEKNMERRINHRIKQDHASVKHSSSSTMIEVHDDDDNDAIEHADALPSSNPARSQPIPEQLPRNVCFNCNQTLSINIEKNIRAFNQHLDRCLEGDSSFGISPVSSRSSLVKSNQGAASLTVSKPSQSQHALSVIHHRKRHPARLETIDVELKPIKPISYQLASIKKIKQDLEVSMSFFLFKRSMMND